MWSCAIHSGSEGSGVVIGGPLLSDVGHIGPPMSYCSGRNYGATHTVFEGHFVARRKGKKREREGKKKVWERREQRKGAEGEKDRGRLRDCSVRNFGLGKLAIVQQLNYQKRHNCSRTM